MSALDFKNANNLFVISAPSGTGKTSLIQVILEQNKGIKLSISYTTRVCRNTEINGKDYYFVTTAEFKEKINNQEFLEYAKVFGNYYGTDKKTLIQQLATGNKVILEIDWQGAKQIKQRIPNCTSIFIIPPSLKELEQRLNNRGTDSAIVINRRLAQAKNDTEQAKNFDLQIVNLDFRKAVQDLTQIIQQG